MTGFFLSGPRVAVWGLLGGLFSTRLPPQYRQRRSPRIRRRYLVGLIDQLAQFGRRVVAGDAAVLVTQQDLPVFLRHAGGTKPATERVLQVMHAGRRKTRRCRSLEALLVHRGRPIPCLAPRRVVHAVHRSGVAILVGLTVGKHPYRIQWLSFAPRLIKRPSGRSLELVDATGIAEKHPVSRVWDHSSSTKVSPGTSAAMSDAQMVARLIARRIFRVRAFPMGQARAGMPIRRRPRQLGEMANRGVDHE